MSAGTRPDEARRMHPVALLDGEGLLDVGEGQSVHWQTYGDPAGRPLVVLHGGPGSGCSPSWTRYADATRYRIVLLDQRGCGRSTPDAADPATDLSANTTQALVADVEALREFLGITRWTVLGGSWGTTLGLAYAQAHPDRVSELVLFSVTTTTAREVQWVTRDVGRIFPLAWTEFLGGVPADERDGDLAAAYARLLADPDPAVRERAARNWCAWEDVHVSLLGAAHDPRYDDPVFRYRFARLVTHYWANAAFLGETELLDGMPRLAGVPGALVTGTADVSSPADTAVALAGRWPDADLVLVDGAVHGGAALWRPVVAALDGFAEQR